jgi:hypothetical protein
MKNQNDGLPSIREIVPGDDHFQFDFIISIDIIVTRGGAAW